MTSLRRCAPTFIAGLLALASLTGVPAGASLADASRGTEAGAPLLRTFGAVDYGGAVQNWAVVQDHRGLIYVGNVEDGVLEYDGARWRRIPTPNRTTIRSLAVDHSGRVYVGGVGEIGYLAPDATGRMQYVSLLDRIAEEERDFADVWRTFATPEGVYFFTFKRLIRISPDAVRVWNASTAFHLSFRVRDSLFVRETGRGLLQLAADELRPVAQGERFADERIYAVLPWPDSPRAGGQALLIGTRTQGWFVLDGESLRPWKTEAAAAINENLLYGAVWLKSGALAASTLHGGVFLLDTEGRLLGRIDKSAGLSNETVFDLFQDRQGGLWLALDSGIARVDVSGPLTRFERRSGIEGSVMAIHRHAGSLYFGTTQGLYRLEGARSGSAHFVKVSEIQGQTWAFAEWNGVLLIANIQGVFELRGGVFRLVRPSQHASTALLPSRSDRARVFVGMLNGLASMRFENGRWLDEGVIAGVPDEVRTMAEGANGRLWVGAAATGVIRLQFPEGFASGGDEPLIERFGAEHGLSRSPHHVYEIGGVIGFSTHQGILRFDESVRRFIPDVRFATLFASEPRLAFPVAADQRGRVWMHTTNESRTVREAGFATLQRSGQYQWDPRPLRDVAGASIAAIHADPDGVLWFGGDETIYRYDRGAPADYSAAPRTLMREVATRDGRLLYGGAGAAQPPRLAFAENALRFEFSASSFGGRPNQFQALLEGVDQDWSPWSTEAYRDYTNIHEGAYRFRVRAMNGFGAVSPEAVYAFRILPPWYRTWLAYLAYAVAAAALLAGASRWRSEALRRRNQELAQLVATRTKELSSANQALRDANTALADLSVTDALTGLKNRRYLVDHIEHDAAIVRRGLQEATSDGGAAGVDAELLFVVVDIDHFKQVNDHYGHAAGDRVLEQFARVLQDACREADTAVRWGGEEFMIVARCAGRGDGPIIAERIRSMTAAHIFLLDDGKTLRRTCSVGFASYPVFPAAPGRRGWEDALKLADQCLYEAKRGGRNGWVGVEPTDATPGCDDPDLALADLALLVERGFLQMHRTAALRTDRRTSAA